MAPSSSENLAPEFRLRVNEKDAPIEVQSDVIEVTVLQDVAAPGMFALRLINWDMDKLAVTWSDADLFAPGSAVEILMGYAGQLATVMTGEVTGLEPDFRAAEVPTVTVRGYDRRHRLMRGRKTRSFTQVKDSAIAAQVAQEAGLDAETQDTEITLEYVMQHNQTDLEFLEARASRLGFEVVVEGKTLKFRPHGNDKAEAQTLARDTNLLEFCPRLSLVGLAGEVQVRGWNPKDKKAVIGKAAAGDEGTAMGKNGGLAAADKAFGAAVAVAVDQPVQSQGEADKIAAGRLREMALSYVTGEGIALGSASLKAGTAVRIDGFGKRFSGLYYLDSARHTYSPRRGYRTAFTVRRNAT